MRCWDDGETLARLSSSSEGDTAMKIILEVEISTASAAEVEAVKESLRDVESVLLRAHRVVDGTSLRVEVV